MPSSNARATARDQAVTIGKRMIPALLLSSAALPMSVMAQKAPPEDTSLDELLGELSPADSKVPVKEPAAASPPTPTPQGVIDPMTDASVVQPPGVPGYDLRTTQSPESPLTEPAASELDIIPVTQLRELAPAPAAKEPPSGRQIEEVVVTAQKREQVSQDVPISMSVLSDVFIKERGITSVADALLFVPNFRVVEYAGRVSPQCRGFTVSEGNPAFEAPCGIALDGVAFSRGAYFSAGLLDLQRVEVLRGPQGTTFGKNTTAGVVSLVSRDPTDEFTANVDLQYGLEGPGMARAEVAAGGALIPGVVNFRVAGLRELRDGYMENTYHRVDPSVSEEVGNNERNAYRFKLAFPDVLGAQVELLHEHTDLYLNGFLTKIIPQKASAAGYIRQYDPYADFGENYKTSNLGTQNWTETTRNQAEVNFGFGDWNFTGVGGFGELTYRSDGFGFPGPFPVARGQRLEESPYVTGEFRAISPDFDGLLGLESLFGIDLGSSSLLVGAFGQRQELKRLKIDAETFYSGVAILILAGQDLPITPPVGSVLALLDRLAGINPSESFHISFSQRADSAALFSQLSWNISPKWSLDLGARVSEESKQAHYDLSYSTPAPLLNTTGDRGFTKDKSLDNSSFQPKVSLTYRLNDDVNLFAHWARAFKSGGFNAYTSTGDPERPNRTNPNATTGSLAYGDETGTDWGFDIKTRLFDNQMQVNLSLFRLDVTDFQVLTEVLGTEIPGSTTRLPNGYQQVVNAGEARAQGAELDVTWLATDWLTVMGALGYNNTKYRSFPLDNCGPNEEPDPETAKCDHSGRPFLNTPKLTGVLSLDTRFPLGGFWGALTDLDFLLGGAAEYTGSQHAGNYTPQSNQDGYFRFRAHTGLVNDSQGWSLRITALNITNEYLATRISDPSAGATNVSPLPPRSIFAQFSWTY